jgi:hypothetical protein
VHSFTCAVQGAHTKPSSTCVKRAAIYRPIGAAQVRGGSLCRAYAITNVREFFAETCESYFGMNDFFPFVRSELQSHDPESFALMEAGRTPRLTRRANRCRRRA